MSSNKYDVLILSATPGGITAAIAAARNGRSVVLLERTAHVGGLPANGLGATDIATRGATAGLFLTFVERNRQHYVATYGANSEQVRLCSDGYHFEPHIGEQTLESMLAEHKNITVLKHRQFDASPANLTKAGGAIISLTATNRLTGQKETYSASAFIDASYEGDLAAAAGAPWRTRRESKSELNEPLAGRVYKAWATEPHEVGEGSTGEGDDTIQAYNYRLCLTDDPALRVTIAKPAGYNRDEYASIVDDIINNRYASFLKQMFEKDLSGIGRIVNSVELPNRKTDSNNQHLAFLSTDLPEENYPWPNAGWAWRDRFAARLRDYILGLIYFAQNDSALPADFRQNCLRWGLAKDEYTDNSNFPRQVYVREGRRIEGEYLFTAHDALPTAPGGRSPIHADSITASHYALDSHAHHKREAGRVHLDGFLSHPTVPYTVPYRVILPKNVDNLLCPVPVSGTHIGFSTIRMEPCWMALGEAAGEAAHLALSRNVTMKSVPIAALQSAILNAGGVLIYYKDASPADPDFKQIQRRGLAGELPAWTARS